MSRPAALRDDDDKGLDEQAGRGLLHRTRHLRGWGKHLHGYACPRCGTTCHDRGNRDLHDMWHRDDDAAWQEWAEVLEAMGERVMKLEAQHELIAKTHGYALAPLLREEEDPV